MTLSMTTSPFQHWSISMTHAYKMKMRRRSLPDWRVPRDLSQLKRRSENQIFILSINKWLNDWLGIKKKNELID